MILSDINMPGMDGLTLLREIKTALARSAGHDGDGLWRRRAAPRADEYGAAEFITKPVDFDLLKAAAAAAAMPAGA